MNKFILSITALSCVAAVVLFLSHPPSPDASGVSGTTLSAPLSFEANLGQADPAVKFLARVGPSSLRLMSDATITSLADSGETIAVTRMRLLGASPPPDIEGLQPLARKTHYFIGDNPAHWQPNVPHYGRVRYHEVYPGIDLDYYYNGDQLEYDFIVAPGADPAVIRLAFEGSEHTALDRSGDLVLRNDAGQTRHHRPFVYQEIAGRKTEIAARYRLSDEGSISFTLARYDPARPLVVDPKISFSTYIGGRSQDFAAAVSGGPDNSLWVAGATQSTNLPVPEGLDRPSLPGLRATFLNKYDEVIDADGRSGRTLSSTIFLGGTAGELPDSIPVALEVDEEGNLYILGETTTTDFPLTMDAHQRTFRGERDMYVTVIAPGGQGGLAALREEREQAETPRLLYSSYLGGLDLEVPTSADLGDCPPPVAGPCFFFAGHTESANLETTENAIDNPARGFEDPLVGILAPDPTPADGFALRYLAILGGRGRDTNPQVLALDGGRFCLAMTTTSDDLPVPPEVLERAMHPSRLADEDAFIMCTALASTAPLNGPQQGDRDPFGFLEVERATYVRGPGRDEQDRIELLNLAESFGFTPAPDLPLDDLREVVLAVIESNSQQMPVDPVVALGEPFLPTNPGDQSGYLLVINRDLTVPLAGGWLGGSGEEEFTGAADLDGYLLIGSNTTSLDWPGALNSFSGGRWDPLTLYIENFNDVTADSLTDAVGGSERVRELLLGFDRELIVPNIPGSPYRHSTTYHGGPGRDEFDVLRGGILADEHAYGAGITDTARSEFQPFPASKSVRQQAKVGGPTQAL